MTNQRFPENATVIFKHVNLTYRELDALVNTLANALLDLGIRKGQYVIYVLFCTEQQYA